MAQKPFVKELCMEAIVRNPKKVCFLVQVAEL